MTATELRLLSELLEKQQRAGSRSITLTDEPPLTLEAVVFSNPLGRFAAWGVR